MQKNLMLLAASKQLLSALFLTSCCLNAMQSPPGRMDAIPAAGWHRSPHP